MELNQPIEQIKKKEDGNYKERNFGMQAYRRSLGLCNLIETHWPSRGRAQRCSGARNAIRSELKTSEETVSRKETLEKKRFEFGLGLNPRKTSGSRERDSERKGQGLS